MYSVRCIIIIFLIAFCMQGFSQKKIEPDNSFGKGIKSTEIQKNKDGKVTTEKYYVATDSLKLVHEKKTIESPDGSKKISDLYYDTSHHVIYRQNKTITVEGKDEKIVTEKFEYDEKGKIKDGRKEEVNAKGERETYAYDPAVEDWMEWEGTPHEKFELDKKALPNIPSDKQIEIDPKKGIVVTEKKKDKNGNETTTVKTYDEGDSARLVKKIDNTTHADGSTVVEKYEYDLKTGKLKEATKKEVNAAGEETHYFWDFYMEQWEESSYKGSDDVNHISAELATIFEDNPYRFNTSGLNAAMVHTITTKMAIIGEAGIYFGSSVKEDHYTKIQIMAGIGILPEKVGRVQFIPHLLAGMAIVRLKYYTLSSTSSSFSAALGTDALFPLNNRMGIVARADYNPTFTSIGVKHNFRLGLGMDFRW